MKIEVQKILSKIFAFSSLDNSQLKELESISKVIEVSKNQLLFSEGDPAKSLFIIVGGKLKVYKTSKEGKEQTIHIQKDGDLVAEAAIFDQGVYPANGRTLNSCVLIDINRDDFIEFLTKNPDATFKLLATYSKRLRQLVSLVEDLSLNEVKLRLAKYLLTHSEKIDQTLHCQLPVSKKEMASFLGTTPENLSRALNYFQKEGIIDNKPSGKIVVLDVKRAELMVFDEKFPFS